MTRVAVFGAAASALMALGGGASANEAFYAVGPRAPTEWVGVTPAQTDHTVYTTGSIGSTTARPNDAVSRAGVRNSRQAR